MRVPVQRAETAGGRAPAVLAAVASGGALGASARHAVLLAWPAGPGGFPWAVLVVNAVGSALIGALMVLVSERGRGHRLARPFLGTGVLGGFTTYSTYALDTVGMVERGQVATALAHLGGTFVAALGAVWAATAVTRALTAAPAAPR
nr:CrcB family protein [Streptomyces taklimakanensis]